MSVQALALILWTLASPYGVIALVAGVGPARRFVARNYLLCVSPGWLAMVAMLYATLALHGPSQVLVLVTAAPLTGLAIWVRERGHDLFDDPFEPEPPPSPPPARERKARQRPAVSADCGSRQRGRAGRRTSRRGAIALPSRARSNA